MKLYPYQVIGSQFLASRKRAALYDEMGVGKTIQAIAATRSLKLQKILIVCPASLILNWWKEWGVWGDPNVTPTIISYNYMREIKRVKIPFDVLIADESQHLGKWTSQQTLTFIKVIAPKAKRLWLLSGTPAVKSASDYHPQLSVLEPGVHGKYWEFCYEHCKERLIGRGRYARKEVYGFRNTKSLNKKIKKVSLRRTAEEVLPELPKKRFSTLYLDVSAEIDERELERGLEDQKMPESLIPPLRQLGLDKVKEAEDYLLSITQPVVAFCWFTATALALEKVFSDRRVGLVTGKQSAAKKMLAVEKFQAGKLDALVCNIAAGGVGWTMTRANLCVFMEFPFSPALYSQAWRRLLRIGQEKKVHIVNVIAEESLDYRVLEVAQQKSKGMKECLA